MFSPLSLVVIQNSRILSLAIYQAQTTWIQQLCQAQEI
jgi:hypothetical protein